MIDSLHSMELISTHGNVQVGRSFGGSDIIVTCIFCTVIEFCHWFVFSSSAIGMEESTYMQTDSNTSTTWPGHSYRIQG